MKNLGIVKALIAKLGLNVKLVPADAQLVSHRGRKAKVAVPVKRGPGRPAKIVARKPGRPAGFHHSAETLAKMQATRQAHIPSSNLGCSSAFAKAQSGLL